MQRLTRLDALRGIAASAVVFQHISERLFWRYSTTSGQEWFSFGYFGVVLFFLLSGFVIAGSLEHTSLPNFWIKRFFRLYPAYLMSMIAVILCGIAHTSWWVFAANLTMLADLFRKPALLSIYWTLELEWFFYIGYTFVVVLRKQHLSTLLLTILLVGAVLVDGVLPVFYGASSTGMLSNIALLLLGVLLHRLWRERTVNLRLLLIVGNLVVLVTALTAYQGQFGAMVSRVAAIACFCVVLRWEWTPQRCFVWLGKISYSLYLFHALIIYAVTPAHPLTAIIVWSVGSVGIAWIVYCVVERPAMRFAQSLVEARRAQSLLDTTQAEMPNL